MKRWILVFSLNFVLSCAEPAPLCSKVEINLKEALSRDQSKIDTVLEIASSEDLDMTVHQLFLDTMKSNRLYQAALREKREQDEKAISQFIHAWNESFSFQDLNHPDFPTIWKAIRKKDDQFVLYDRCNGSDPEFIVYRNVLIFNETLERDIKVISAVEDGSEQGVKYELEDYTDKAAGSSDEGSFVSISKMDGQAGVYLFHHKTATFERREYVIPSKEAKSYSLIVNHCPISMLSEYDGFDEQVW